MTVSHQSEILPTSVGSSEQLFFNGDQITLAGQIDYPRSESPADGFPLIFVVQHATCTSRQGYLPVTRVGTESGAAVFRWDKRGTGASGSGGRGSTTVDMLSAYRTAIMLSGIDSQRVVIYAQLEGTLLLAEAFDQFCGIVPPAGVVLAGNMLDEQAVLQIKARIHVIVSKNDWNPWQTYAEGVAQTHARMYGYPPSFYVPPNADRKLRYTQSSIFHRGVEESIKTWMAEVCQIS